MLKLLEWTDEHLEAFRRGLEHSTEELSLNPTAEKEQLESAAQKAFRLRQDLASRQHRLRMQQEENAVLRQELKQCKRAKAATPVAEKRHAAEMAPMPTFSGETKTVKVEGHQVSVPARWSHKQIRQWMQSNRR
ncbi:hypothetical protein [Corynebacterium pseudodiphtheriticum]|uniref:hypothetical protein n=1 Tax=Corynebacterium pseudodiphtheriticum TaxID=37637 RepID=UPI0025438263|nr:hypothetical protein [Corynebacterium pseudodiphtheriticum]MDK4318449.1 hypothetical protein [Corynebacterium pseudodiphtheriticum]